MPYIGPQKSSEGAEKCSSVVTFIVITILVCICYAYSILHLRCDPKPHLINEICKLKENLESVLSQMETLQSNHSRLVFTLEKMPWLINSSILQLYSVPGTRLKEESASKEYEILRRRISSNIKDLWYYIKHQLNILMNESQKSYKIQIVINEVAERKRWLLSNQESLRCVDGHEEWRSREAASVSSLIQRRLNYLQNPKNCSTAKKLVCINDASGFGSKIHHLVYCLANAYFLERTLVLLNLDNTMYMYDWSKIFHPLSETCTESNTYNIGSAADKSHHNDTLLYLPLMRYTQNPPVHPHLTPEDLALRISRFNGDPYSWWIGQLVKYIVKLQKPSVLENIFTKMDIKTPIVGIHIRHTDKVLDEGGPKYHRLDEYMSEVEEYYAQLELTHSIYERRVFIATDDVDVLSQAIAKYPQYTFYGDHDRAELAGTTSLRYTSQALSDFLVDVHLLARCDYVICTFSSNIGRLAYELMQTRVDATNYIVSLDWMYYFTYLEKHYRVAVMNNKNIHFNVNDLIDYNYTDIRTRITGTVIRKNSTGLFPLYKTEERVIKYPFPKYEMVPLYVEIIQEERNYTCS